jgi:hypothetical protein
MAAQIDYDDMRKAMNHLARVFAKAENGKQLKRELSKRLREILKPLVDQRRAAVLALPSKGHAGPSMRQAIARQTRAATRWRGKNTGVSVIQRARSMPRSFNMAGRAFNREMGWTPTTLGGIKEHQQMRPANWFDGKVKEDRPLARRQIEKAIGDASDKMADEIRRYR